MSPGVNSTSAAGTGGAGGAKGIPRQPECRVGEVWVHPEAEGGETSMEAGECVEEG